MYKLFFQGNAFQKEIFQIISPFLFSNDPGGKQRICGQGNYYQKLVDPHVYDSVATVQ